MPKYTRNISERKRMGKNLEESENRFREIVEHAPIAIACYDDKRDSVFANRKFEELTGYSLSEIPTADIFRNLVFPDEGYRNWVYNKWTVNNDFRIEVDLHCKNGEIKSVEATKSVYEDQTYIIANDVTDRKKATEEMSISEGKYRRMFYENPYPVWIYDITSLKILEVNHAAIQKYGYDKKEFSDLTLKDIVSKQDLVELLEFMNQRKKKSKDQKKLWNYLKKNGETMVRGSHAAAAAVLHTNFYSYAAGEYPFVNHHWLAGVVFFLVGKLGTFDGLTLFYSLLVILAVAISYWTAQRVAHPAHRARLVHRHHPAHHPAAQGPDSGGFCGHVGRDLLAARGCLHRLPQHGRGDARGLLVDPEVVVGK